MVAQPHVLGQKTMAAEARGRDCSSHGGCEEERLVGPRARYDLQKQVSWDLLPAVRPGLLNFPQSPK
jgi:hypothetical protein